MTMRFRRLAPRPPSAPLVAFGLLSLAGLLFARIASPDRVFAIFRCPFRAATGVPCPTCGMTRAVCRVVRGELVEAVAMSPLGALLAGVAVVTAAWMLLRIFVVARGVAVDLTAVEARIARAMVIVAFVANWGWIAARGVV